MNEEDKKKINQFLSDKIRSHGLICPMCGGKNFQLLGQYIVPPAQEEMDGLRLGEAFPMVGIACTNCGFVSHHLVGVVYSDALKKRKQRLIADE